ncbi:hypothetical protein GF324_14080 [bacterium]|nr:hypothetical protein [bacterium]
MDNVSESGAGMFDTIIGQERVKATLISMIDAGNIPHAMLFAGPNGVGKSELARAMAAGLLCESGTGTACGACNGCRRAMKLEHPDLHVLFPFRRRPESADSRGQWDSEYAAHRARLRDEPYPPMAYGQSVMIVRGLVDEVRDRLLSSSFEGGRKVCLIFLAEKMNAATANSILKILEEPPAGVHFILTAERVSSVLPTITSRCAVFRFRRLRQDEIAGYLETVHGLDRERADRSAQMADGSMKQAKSLAFEQSGDAMSRAYDLYTAVAIGTGDTVIEASHMFLRSRDSAEAEELLTGFIHCTRAVLARRCGIKQNAEVMSGELASVAMRPALSNLDRLSQRLEEGIEMLGRNVAVTTVLTATLYHIHETYHHGRA